MKSIVDTIKKGRSFPLHLTPFSTYDIFRKAMLTMVALFCGVVSVLGQAVSNTYLTANNGTATNQIIIPANVTSITVECWGGGGGGGNSNNSSAGGAFGGSGGGGGAYAKKVFSGLAPGTYTIFVGAGGAGAPASSTTTAGQGGDSYFYLVSGTDLVLAKGGSRGNNSGTATGGAGGLGAPSSLGDLGTVFPGGSGGNSTTNGGGAGGSSAGTALLGTNGAIATNGSGTTSATTAPTGGGNGGYGNSGNTNPGTGAGNGQAGSLPGGGGGGSNDVATAAGGAGANGSVIISYTIPTISSFSPTSMCAGSSTSIIITGTGFSTTPSNNVVKFFDGAASTLASIVTASTATTLTTTVPVGAVTGIVTVTTSGNTNSTSPTFTANSNVLPTASNLSATASSTCSGSGSVVTVTSTTLSDGPYTVTYNVSGTNTIASTTAIMTFSDASNTGTFTTANLSTAGASNVVHITDIAFQTSGTCTKSVTASTSAFTTYALPNVANFALVSASTVAGDKAVITVNSTSLTDITTYTVTYTVSGANTQASTTSTLSFGTDTGTFETVALSSSGSNTVTITAIQVTGSNCPIATSGANFSTTFSTLTARNCVSDSNGQFHQANTWTCNGNANHGIPVGPTDDITIQSAHSVNLVQGNGVTVHNFILEGSLSDNDNNNDLLTVTGNVTINGTISGGGAYTFSGSGKTITGTGNLVNPTTVKITGDKTISSSANLLFSGGIFIIGAYTVTNNGTMTVGGTITGTSTSSVWTNAANSTLNIDGGSSATTAIFNSTTGGTALGTLNASAVPNTINYYSSSSSGFFIATPSTVSGYPTYHNLTISGGGTKFWPSTTIAVNGDLTLNATLDGNGANKVIRLRGNWINNSSTGFTEGAGTVIFDGIADQSITKSVDETFNHLTINKTSGTLTLYTNVIVGTSDTGISILTMTSGNINTGSYTLTLGKGGLNLDDTYSGRLYWTSGTIIGKFNRYIYSASHPSSNDLPALGQILFPVGTSSYYRPTYITTINGITAGSLTAEFNTTFPGSSGLAATDADLVVSYNTFRDGYWTLTEANSFAANYTLNCRGTGFSGFPPPINNDTRLLNRTASLWSFNGSHVTYVSNNVVSRSGLTTFGDFAFGDDTNCVNPIAPIFAVGSTNPCLSSAASPYSLTTSTPGSTYNWTINGGTQASGGTTSSITVDWGASAIAGSVVVYEINSSGCSGPDQTLSVNVQPLSPTAPTGNSGNTEVPQNSDGLKPYITYTTPLQTYYSQYQWSVTGGTIYDMANVIQTSPLTTTSNSVQVRWGTAGTGSICVSGVNACGTSSPQSCTTVSIYNLIYSVKSGSWTNNNGAADTWSCACIPTVYDNIFVVSPHIVTISDTDITAKNLIVAGTLNTGSSSTRTLTITGNLTFINGTIGGTTAAVNLNSGTVTNLYIDGTGTISNTQPFYINSSRTILSTGNISKSTGIIYVGDGNTPATLTNNGTLTSGGTLTVRGSGILTNNSLVSGANVVLNAGSLFTNNATATVSGNITGLNGTTSIWTNAANSTLNIAGSLLTIVPGGRLNASATGNTVHYTGAATQAIKSPSSNATYYNLSFSGAGEKTAPASSVRVNGNFTNDGTAVTANGLGFNPNGGTINFFNGTSSILGSSSTTFNNITVSAAANLTSHATQINVRSNFTNNGAFAHNNGIVNFIGGTTSIAGSSTTTFNNLQNNSTVTLNATAPLFRVAANFTNNAAFSGGTGTAEFIGLPSAILGATTPNFHHLTTTGTLTSNVSVPINVSGNFTNNGSFLHNSGIVNFNGTSSILGSSESSFYTLTIASPNSLTSAAGTINVARDFTNNSTFTHNSGTVNFNGLSTISGSALTGFNKLTIDNSSTLNSPSINIAGDFTNDGTFNHTTGTVTFNGTSIVGGSPVAFPTTFNNLTLNGTSLTFPSTQINVRGDITFTLGDFIHSNGLVELNGTANQTISANGETFYDLTTEKANGTSAILDEDIIVENSLSLTTGNFDLASWKLTLNGAFNGANTPDHFLVSNSNSTLEINGSGVLGDLYFPTGSTLGTLTINRSGLTANLPNLITISSQLNLSQGELDNSAGVLTMSLGSTISRTSDGTFSLGSVTPTGGPYNLSYSNGSLSSYGADVELNGSINNIANNVTGLITQKVGASVNLVGLMSFGNTTSSFATNGQPFTVNSVSDTTDVSGNANLNGVIGEIKSGGSFTGIVKVERFMGRPIPAKQVNRYISSPVVGAKFSDVVTNNPGNTPFSIVRNVAQYYFEPTAGGQQSGYRILGLGSTLSTGFGYLIMPTAGFSNSNIVWDVNGQINQGSINLAPKFTNTVNPDADGWNLLGNPYPSPILWDNDDISKWSNLAGSDSATVEPVIFVPDLTGAAGQYRTYNYLTGTGTLPYGKIAMGQAFWVKATGPNPEMVVHEGAKTTGTSEFLRKKSVEVNGLTVSISTQTVSDVSWLLINPAATVKFESKHDFSKLESESLAVSFEVENRKMIYSTMDRVGDNDLPLSVKVADADEVTFSFAQLGNMPEFDQLFLVDRKLGNAHKISSGSYSFRSTANMNSRDRFFLTTHPETALGDDMILNVFPNPAMETIHIKVLSTEPSSAALIDMRGTKLMEGVLELNEGLHSGSFDLNGLPQGIYFVKAFVGGKTVVKKIVKR
jgi:Secretion system C-terminal sorting domain/PKD-like domain